MISAAAFKHLNQRIEGLCSLETLPFVKGKRLPLLWGLQESKAGPVTVVPVDELSQSYPYPLAAFLAWLMKPRGHPALRAVAHRRAEPR